MLDTSREFFYPDTIKQLIDGMMLARMNVFHWHFVDSDSMPMYLESYPDLTNYTAFSKKEIYTPDDVKDIVKYAQVRGIKVVPEFEGPGHMNSLGQYPAFQKSIGCYRDSKVYNQASGGPPDSVIDPVNNSTYQFLYNFMKDLNKTFESDYWHLGGDEVEAKCFSDIAGVNEFLTKNKMGVNQLQQYYTTKERDIFTEINPSRIAGYWYQSEKLSYHPNDILQYWGPSNKIRDEMAYHADNYFVISSSDHYYLDCGYSNQFGDRSWCGPIKSWKEFWSIDPSMYSSAGKLLGAEACAWSEMNNEFELFTKVFPRSGAMSFRYWNPKAPTQEGALHEMMMRLQYRLKAYGVPTEKISMRYCEEHTHHCFGI